MNIKAELAALEKMTTGELAERYAALTDQPVRTRHRAYLIRKIAWRLQADAEGDLSERARRRAAELADLMQTAKSLDKCARRPAVNAIAERRLVASGCMWWTAFRHRFRHHDVTELGTGM